MSEQKVLRLVNCDETNQVTSRRTHRFADCSMLDSQRQIELTDREAGLLGLSECKVCLKRAEGGPALEAMKSILAKHQVYLSAGSGSDKDDSLLECEPAARMLIDGLRAQGFYLSQRSPKES